MITNKQILEILIKYDPNPFMVQDTLELSDCQYFCDNLETLFENVQEKLGTLSAIQAFDDGFCFISNSIKYRYFVLNINNVMDCTNSTEEAWKLLGRESWEESKRRFYEIQEWGLENYLIDIGGPENYKCDSVKNVYWLCPKCNTHYRMNIDDRVIKDKRHHEACWKCSGRMKNILKL